MGFEEYVSEFDLENFELSSLLSEGAIALDNHRLGQASEAEYRTLDYISDLILRKSREVRSGNYHVFEDLFFWEFYDKEQVSQPEFQKICADRLVVLSEELKAVRDLSPEKVEKTKSLTDTILKLSRATQTYWVQKYPQGFKHYVA